MPTKTATKTKSSGAGTKVKSAPEAKAGVEDLNEELLEELENWLDPQLFEPKYDQYRPTQFPYGIVANKEEAGIFLPLDQLEQAEWQSIPKERDLDSFKPKPGGETLKGVLLTEGRMIILFVSPTYVAIKKRKKGEVGILGLLDEFPNFDKKKHSSCEDYCVIFLDDKNQPLHNPQKPFKVTFKNVARVSMAIALKEFYRNVESLYTKLFKRRLQQNSDRRTTGKSDEWRALVVVEVTFHGVEEGEEDQSYCCKVENITKITPQNFKRLFLGNPNQVEMVGEVYANQVAGLGESYTMPALLPAAVSTGTVEVLPPVKNGKQNKQRAVVDDPEDLFDPEDAIDVDVSDDFDDDLDDLDEE